MKIRLVVRNAFILLCIVIANMYFTAVPMSSSDDAISHSIFASATTYTVFYNLNDGTIEDASYITSFTADTETTLLPRAAKTGYKFDGWYLDSVFSLDKRIDRITQGTTSDVTVYAKFTPINYYVQIESLPGVVVEADTVSGLTMATYNKPYNIALTLGEGYKKSTSVYLDIAGVKVEYYAVEQDTYFFRVPVSIVNKGDFSVTIENITIDSYTITYEYNSDTFTDTRLYGEIYYLNDTMFTRLGYIQVGWALDNLEFGYGDGVMVTGNMTFSPVWEVEVYPIMYTLYEGQATNPTSYTVLDEIQISNPTRLGFEFLGWRGTGIPNSTKSLVIRQGSVGERSYEAMWKLIPYYITYNLDGGTITNNITTFTIVTPDISLSKPVKTGYSFVCWRTDLDTVITKISRGTVGDISLTAEWDIVEYDITYNLNGGTLIDETSSYTILDEVTLVEPTRDGYVFGGWYESKSTVGNDVRKISIGSTGDIQFYAKWLQAYVDYSSTKMTSSISNDIGIELGVTSHVSLLEDKYEIYLCNSFIEDYDFDDGIDYEIKQIFDIYLLKDSTIYSDFSGTYVVKIKLTDPYYKTTNATVLARNDQGGVDALETRIEGEYLIFETDHFSRFVLVGKTVDTLVGMQWTVFIIVLILMLVVVVVSVIFVYLANEKRFEKIFKYISKDFYKKSNRK